MQKMYSLWVRWRLEECGAAAERALEHARAAGDRMIETDARAHVLATSALGPRPLPQTLDATRRALDMARATGDRGFEWRALRGVAIGSALMGDPETARRLIEESRAIVRELGLVIDYWAESQNVALVEILGGDLDEAARELAEGCEQLQSLGETAFLSTAATMLAVTQFRRGDSDAAERWLDVAERTASAGDRSSQVGIEAARGLLLIAKGDRNGERHLRAAIELLDDSDAMIWRADLRLHLAAALIPYRPGDAASLASEALAIAGRKQVPALVAAARGILAELGHEVDG